MCKESETEITARRKEKKKKGREPKTKGEQGNVTILELNHSYAWYRYKKRATCSYNWLTTIMA